jgi:hypothetical protein
VGPVKPRQADVLPIGAPSRAELWRRSRLALSVLDQRGLSAATAALVHRILLGASVDELPRG